MHVEPAPKVAEYYDERMSDFLDGRLEIPAVRHTERRPKDKIHLSDLEMCPLPAYYERMIPKLPPFNNMSVMQMFRGRVIEHVLAEESKPVTVGAGEVQIIMTTDGRYPGDDLPIEIKTTLETPDIFRPESSHVEWVNRLMGYCMASGKLDIYLYVYFLGGNLMNYPWWMNSNMVKSMGKEWRKKCKYRTADSAAWKFMFTKDEVLKNWKEVEARGWLLKNSFEIEDEKKHFHPEYIVKHRPHWQCKRCRYAINHCYYMQEHRDKDEKRTASRKVQRRR